MRFLMNKTKKLDKVNKSLRIACDFDGVIVPPNALLVGECFTSPGVKDLLENNVIDMILTGRSDLLEIISWLSVFAPNFSGEVNSAALFGDSKSKYLSFRHVDVYVTDLDEWIMDLREWVKKTGGRLIVFDIVRDKCLKDKLIKEKIVKEV